MLFVLERVLEGPIVMPSPTAPLGRAASQFPQLNLVDLGASKCSDLPHIVPEDRNPRASRCPSQIIVIRPNRLHFSTALCQHTFTQTGNRAEGMLTSYASSLSKRAG